LDDLVNRKSKNIQAKKKIEKNTLKKDQSQIGLVFQISNPGHETRVAALKTNP
jgi:hypothetical protein